MQVTLLGKIGMKFIKPYEGRLDSRMLKEGRLKDAYTSLRGQRYRCNNKNSEDYKWYGAKGIKVIYPTRYFIGWYLKEAKRFKKGEKWHIVPTDAAKYEQEMRYEMDVWEEIIRSYLHSQWVSKVTTCELLIKAIGFERDRIKRGDQMRVSKAMTHIGWPAKRDRSGRFWERPKEPEVNDSEV